jgi:uncharacterized protein (DUF2147 family)
MKTSTGASVLGILLRACAAVIAPVALSSVALAQPVPRGPLGVWINPHANVKVATVNCGGKLCGAVVWANDEAKQDARDGGVAQLIGTQLLQDYEQTGPGKWTGRVFVPDMGRTFYSTITQLDPSSLKISGCILGGWICKSQVWRRA